ncbi:ArsA-related P-loop ATPase [Ornithinicoccus halotolerans]|uniref:ArsA-related P-loop ATPase n=1 Tax=Ornithinicoccus halotolerans TaxID=1748220 RepID=UPI0012961A5D|nr:ArsA-related P-loop ATPase [Ornithinicoccus halotolerans]
MSLHVLTGKGGTGKTTVAAAMAVALAAPGRRVLLVEVEGRQGISQVLDVAPLGTEERTVTAGLAGGEVTGLSVEPSAAFVEYLRRFYRIGGSATGGLLRRAGVVEFATTVAPGVRDVLLTGKVYDEVRRYDEVVLDAPPTGRIGRFLDVSRHLADLARVGPVHRHARVVRDLLHSPATRVHVVTTLEPMPVQETTEALAELRESGLPLGSVVVNRVRSLQDAAVLIDGLPTEALVARELAAARLDPALASSLLAGGREAIARWEQEHTLGAEVAGLGRPVLHLDEMAEGIGPGEVHALAHQLREQGWGG